MAHKSVFLWIGMAAVLFGGCASIDTRLEKAGTIEAVLRAAADYYVDDRGESACVVALALPNQEPIYACAGEADEKSIFRIASLSKLYLSGIYLKLHEEGRLNLDASVSSCSKMNLPPEWDKVTLRDLIRHRSGLPREFRSWMFVFSSLNCGFFGTHIYADYEDRDGFLEALNKRKYRRLVNSRLESYSNVGFGLLGSCVEDAMDTSLDSLLQEELVRPLGLKDTSFAPDPSMTNRLTVARAGSLPFLCRRKSPVPDHRLGPMLRGTGGIYSSTRDAVKVFTSCWERFKKYERTFPIHRLKENEVWGCLRAHILSDGRRILYRAGMYYGGASFVIFDPERQIVLTVMRNVTEWPDVRAFAVYDSVLKLL